MKKTTKISLIITIFFLIITIVIVGRTLVGNHFKKKFSKRPPPSIIVSEVIKKEFSDNIESFGTAIAKKTQTFRGERKNLLSDLDLKDFVEKRRMILHLPNFHFPIKIQ